MPDGQLAPGVGRTTGGSPSTVTAGTPATAMRPPPPSLASSDSREPEGLLDNITAFCSEHLNFYRVHVIAFIIVPLISAAIFYGSNGANHIAFIDALFMCTSAMTVTGLNSVLLVSLTSWQQAILFILMCLGSTSGVSILTIIIRRHFFRRRFRRIVQTNPQARARVAAVQAREAAKRRELLDHLWPLTPEQRSESRLESAHGSSSPSDARPAADDNGHTGEHKPSSHWHARRRRREQELARERIKKFGIRADMVRRVDEPVRINAMSVGGHLDTNPSANQARGTPHESPEHYDFRSPLSKPDQTPDAVDGQEDRSKLGWMAHPDATGDDGTNLVDSPLPEDSGDPSEPEDPVAARDRRNSDSAAAAGTGSSAVGFQRSVTLGQAPPVEEAVQKVPLTDLGPDPRFTSSHDRRGSVPRTTTVEFKEPRSARFPESQSGLRLRNTRTAMQSRTATRRQSLGSIAGGPTALGRSRTNRGESMHTGFGGFPNPVFVAGELGAKLIRKAIPATATMPPRSATLQSVHSTRLSQDLNDDIERAASKPVTYISFDAVVGRNSHFHNLTDAQQEELGGVEYRALGLLLKLIPTYWLGFQLVGVTLIAPWLSVGNRFRDVFSNAGDLDPTWYSFFQVSSAFTNCGMSLVDSSMVAFQRAYLMIIVMCVLILAGNTAFPIFLRLFIWILHKIIPRRQTETRETLQFLLDHPRRCFIYLFPAYQTWFLLFSLVVLNCTDWVAFLVLDIGNSVLETIPVGTRIIDGLLQSLAVRAAGFQIVSLSALAPAVQVLYIIMMYIAVYPIALSIRTSNVYEERSLGIFEQEESEDSSEEEDRARQGATSYIAFHARKQLSFDLWWLVLGVFIICIVERHQITDPANVTFFTIFSIMFEVTSAYGTVGLSLGLPYINTSLSGQFRILSKLVVCAVMIRGRHRGLPIALDRAVLLPQDLEQQNDFRAPTRTSAEFSSPTMMSDSLRKKTRTVRDFFRRDTSQPPPATADDADADETPPEVEKGPSNEGSQ